MSFLSVYEPRLRIEGVELRQRILHIYDPVGIGIRNNFCLPMDIKSNMMIR